MSSKALREVDGGRGIVEVTGIANSDDDSEIFGDDGDELLDIAESEEEVEVKVAGTGRMKGGRRRTRLSTAFIPPTKAELEASQRESNAPKGHLRSVSFGEQFLPEETEELKKSEGEGGGGLPKRQTSKLFKIVKKAQKDEQARELVRLYEWRKLRRKLLRQAFMWYSFMILFLIQVFLARQIGDYFHIYFAVHDALIDEEFLYEDSNFPNSFKLIRHTYEFYQWARGPLVGAIANDDYAIYKYNSILGRVRFRQLRVKPEQGCIVDRNYRDISTHCWGGYRYSRIDRAPFGRWNQWQYMPASETKEIGVWATAPGAGMWTTYDGGGHVLDLPSPYPGAPKANYSQELVTEIDRLEKNGWIDDQTRAVFVDVNMFNGNYNTFANAKMLLEFPAAGDILPRFLFTPFKMSLYVTSMDKFRGFIEVILVFFLVYFTLSFMFELFANFSSKYRVRGEKWYQFYYHPWNVLDFINIVLFWCIFIQISMYIVEDHYFDYTQDKYYAIHPIGYSYVNIFYLISFNILLSFVKSFKYLRMFPRLLLLWDTLRLAGPDLSAFLIMFFIIFLGFVGMGYVLFGPQQYGFRDVAASITSVMNMTLGDLDYAALKQINRILGPLFFFLFLILVFFVLANMFFAIIVEKFGEAQARSEHSDPILREIVNVLKRVPQRIYRRSVRTLGKKLEKSEEELLDEFAFRSRTVRRGSLASQGTLKVEDVARVMGRQTTHRDLQRTLSAYRTMRIKAGLSVTNIEKASSSSSSSSSEDEDDGAGLLENEEREAEVAAEKQRMISLHSTHARLENKVDTLLRTLTKVQAARSSASLVVAAAPTPRSDPSGGHEGDDGDW